MTTVDFWAKRVDAPGARIALSNGMSGPATTALQRLRDAILSGEVEGNADGASASTPTIAGSQLRRLLTGLGDDGRAVFVGREGHHDEETLQAAIAEDGTYTASAVEA